MSKIPKKMPTTCDQYLVGWEKRVINDAAATQPNAEDEHILQMTGVLRPTFLNTPGLHFLFDIIVEDGSYFIIISNQEKDFLHLEEN